MPTLIADGSGLSAAAAATATSDFGVAAHSESSDAPTSSRARSGSKTVVYVLAPGYEMLAMTSVSAVLKAANRAGGRVAYRLIAASQDGGAVYSDVGLPVETVSLGSLFQRKVDTLVVLGPSTHDDDEDHAASKLLKQLRVLARKAGRLAAIGMGVPSLVLSDLVTGRRVAVHPDWFTRLRASGAKVYPELTRQVVVDRELRTCAYAVDGIALALDMVEADHSRALMLEAARSVGASVQITDAAPVVAPPPIPMPAASTGQSEFTRWIKQHLSERLDADTIAAQFGMRTAALYRECVRQEGRTPDALVLQIRVAAALERLASGDAIDQVIKDCGLSSTQQLATALIGRGAEAA